MRRDLLRILSATFVSWTGMRLTEVALPLIALQQTGSVWATGLVAGSSGISLLTSPWWAARLRHRLTSGPALAAVLCVQALGHVTVAVAATLDILTVVHLCLSGLIVGAATSVGGPATRAMLADLGDRIGAGVAVRALAWQDLAHRISMVAAPPVAAWVVTQHGALPLMWADTIAVLLAAALVARVGRYALRRGSAGEVPRRVREVLRAHPAVADGIAMAAVGWFWWFAFALGLAILGVETGRPGQLIAAGMAGYGAGSLAGSAIALGVGPWWMVAVLFASGLFPILQDWLRYRAMAVDRRWDVALSDGLRLVFVLVSPVVLLLSRDPAVYQSYLGLSLAIPVLVTLIRLPRPARFTPLRTYLRPAGLQLADFAIGQFNSTLPLLVLGALGASALIGGVRFAQTLLGPLNLVFAASTTNLIADGATRGTYASTEDLIHRGTRLARVIGLVAVGGVTVLTAAVALTGFELHGVANEELVVGLALVGAATLSSGWAGIHAIVMRLMGYQGIVTAGRAFLVFISLSGFTIGYLLGGVDVSHAAGFLSAAVAAPLAFIVPASVLYRRHRRGDLVELGPERAREAREEVELEEEDTPVRGLPDDSAPGTI